MIRKSIAGTLLALAIASCTQVRSEYTKFDNLPESTTGKTVFLIPTDGQKGSAEWQAYADMVVARLAEYGIKRASDFGAADYAAVISYGVGGTATESGILPTYGQTGGGVSRGTGTIYGGGSTSTYSGTTYSPSTYGITGFIPYRRSRTDRYFSIRMIDLAASTPENLVAAYEASVLSTGRSKTLGPVAPCMIKALFDDFRGSESDRETIPLDEC